ncbi:hypothetical protein [Streptomyces sp. 2A115]|uniref:hypothetical protein n=1 Tax=Streptomyces sp. 2A115 TaxID=3457439 RepID=UPI003FD0D534
MDRESQRADRTVWIDWADADLVAANAEGRVTPAQRAMIIGNSRVPHVWWPLLIVAGWVLIIAGCGLRAAGCGLRAAGCGLRAACWRCWP